MSDSLSPWTPLPDPTVRSEHRVWPCPRYNYTLPDDGPRSRCIAVPMLLRSSRRHYPKRWSRAKRKAARAQEKRSVDRAVARLMLGVCKFRRAP